MGQDVRSPRGPRCIALVGPFQSGKTTLLEAILARTGAIQHAGSVDAGTSVGDASPEARHHKMSVGLTAATTSFMGDSYTFIDCPGSVEFAHDMRAALPAVDAAVVVCEADEKKLPQLQIILRELEDLKIPRFLFLNKIDRANKRIRETLATLQPASRVPLVLRQIPIWNGELIEGFVDLALERAFVYREHKASEVVALEGGNLDREKEARFSMLEKLADHDDALMEQLLEDIQPPRDAVFDDLARELREGLICPVLLGSAARENGVLRLMKALRHESPGVARPQSASACRRRRRRWPMCSRPCICSTAASCRWCGCSPAISTTARRCNPHPARAAACPAFSRSAAPMTASARRRRPATPSRSASSTPIKTGDTLSERQDRAGRAGQDRADAGGAVDLDRGHRPQGRRQARPGAAAAQRGRSLADHGAEPAHPRHRAVGAGRDASARGAWSGCSDRFGVNVKSHPPAIGYQETIRKADHPARPAQEAVRRPWPVRRRRARHQADAARRGLRVRREGGRRRGAAQLHRRGRGRRGRRAGARPARLPGDRRACHADRRLLSQRRFLRPRVPYRGAGRRERRRCRSASRCCWSRSMSSRSSARPTRPPRSTRSCRRGAARSSASTPARAGAGWDCVRATMPEAEIGDLIVELRSATAGAGSFTRQFDRMAEVTGRDADKIIAAHRDAA